MLTSIAILSSMVRLSLPGFNQNDYSATQPPPTDPNARREKFSALRRAIVFLFLIILFAFLLGVAWYLVENGYLGSLR
jgi:hypothetical protein